MISRNNLKSSSKAFVLSALIFIFSRVAFAQTSTSVVNKEGVKKQNVLETYYEKTVFKVKSENGNISTTDKKFSDLNMEEKKALPNIFFDDRRLLSKEEIIDKLTKGGPEMVEIDLYATKYKEVKAENGVYQTSDLKDKPTYPGGMEEFYNFVRRNFKMPKIPDNVFVKGKIYVTFVVQKDGSLSGLKILRDLGYGMGTEALRVVKLSEKWIPGKFNGQTVAAQYSLPITIG